MFRTRRTNPQHHGSFEVLCAPSVLDLLQFVCLERLGVLGEAERVESTSWVDALRSRAQDVKTRGRSVIQQLRHCRRRSGQQYPESQGALPLRQASTPLTRIGGVRACLEGISLSAAGGLNEGDGHELDDGQGRDVERHLQVEEGH